MSGYADADPIERVVTFLAASSEVGAEFNAVSSEVEGPFPHLRVIPASGGTMGNMRWQHSAGVQVEAIGDPSGLPGKAELRRRFMVAVAAVGQMSEQVVSDPTATVVTFVEATSEPIWLPLDEGNPRWLGTFVVGVRPGLE